MRRENLDKEERRRLIYEDQREERELRNYVVQALATSIGRLLPNSAGAPQVIGTGSEIKVPERRSAVQVWREARGETGPQPHGGRDGSPPNRPREGH